MVPPEPHVVASVVCMATRFPQEEVAAASSAAVAEEAAEEQEATLQAVDPATARVATLLWWL